MKIGCFPSTHISLHEANLMAMPDVYATGAVLKGLMGKSVIILPVT